MLFYLLNMAKCPSRLQGKTTYLIPTHILNTFILLKYLSGLYWQFSRRDDRKQEEREGGSDRQQREDKASVHGSPALPTELNGRLSLQIFTIHHHFICWSTGKLSDSLCFRILGYLGHSSTTLTSHPESDLRGKWPPCEHGLKFMACSVCFETPQHPHIPNRLKLWEEWKCMLRPFEGFVIHLMSTG